MRQASSATSTASVRLARTASDKRSVAIVALSLAPRSTGRSLMGAPGSPVARRAQDGAQLGDADGLRQRADHREPMGRPQPVGGIEHLGVEPADDEDPRLAGFLGQETQKLDAIALRN